MIDFAEMETPASEIRLKVMGIGGGGCHVLYRLAQDHVPHVELVAVNTDEDVVNTVVKHGGTGIQIGEKLTHGNGAGGKVEIGEQAAEEAKAQIGEAFKDVNLVFLSALSRSRSASRDAASSYWRRRLSKRCEVRSTL